MIKSKVAAQWLQKVWRFIELRAVRRACLVVILLAALATGLPLAMDGIGHALYANKNYDSAQKVWRATAYIAWFDSDTGPANAGLAYYGSGQNAPAIDQLEKALKRANQARDCKIRWNLAIVLAARAGEQSQQNPNGAIGDYARAIAVLSSESCRNNALYSTSFAELSSQLDAKMQAIIRQVAEQHKRTDNQEKTDKSTPTDQATRQQQQQERLIEYQNNLDNNRYSSQTDEEKNKSYEEKAW